MLRRPLSCQTRRCKAIIELRKIPSAFAPAQKRIGIPHAVDVRNTPNGVWKTCVITVLMTAAI